MASSAVRRPARRNIVYFARALRAAGLPVGPGAVLDALAAVEAAKVGTREDFYWTLHAVFVKRHEHTVLFDQAFRIFFRRRGYLERLIAMMHAAGAGGARGGQKPALQRLQEALFSGVGERQAAQAGTRRSRSMPASRCPTARCCRRRTSPR